MGETIQTHETNATRKLIQKNTAEGEKEAMIHQKKERSKKRDDEKREKKITKHKHSNDSNWRKSF